MFSWHMACPHRNPGEDGFLPAFLGTGMIPLVLTVLFGIKRGALVIVPVHLQRGALIDFQMSGEGGNAAGRRDCAYVLAGRNGYPKGWSCHMKLVILSGDQIDGDKQIPSISQVSSFAYTWMEHVHEVPQIWSDINTFEFLWQMETWPDFWNISRDFGAWIDRAGTRTWQTPNQEWKATDFKTARLTDSDTSYRWVGGSVGGMSVFKMAASYSLETCRQYQIPSISSCCKCTLAKNLGQSVLNCWCGQSLKITTCYQCVSTNVAEIAFQSSQVTTFNWA